MRVQRRRARLGWRLGRRLGLRCRPRVGGLLQPQQVEPCRRACPGPAVAQLRRAPPPCRSPPVSTTAYVRGLRTAPATSSFRMMSTPAGRQHCGPCARRMRFKSVRRGPRRRQQRPTTAAAAARNGGSGCGDGSTTQERGSSLGQRPPRAHRGQLRRGLALGVVPVGQAVQEGGLVLDVRAQEPLLAADRLQAAARDAAHDKVLEKRGRLGLGHCRLRLLRRERRRAAACRRRRRGYRRCGGLRRVHG
jgi:hypothetical protein